MGHDSPDQSVIRRGAMQFAARHRGAVGDLTQHGAEHVGVVSDAFLHNIFQITFFPDFIEDTVEIQLMVDVR